MDAIINLIKDKKNSNIIIAGHAKPDGDALGSCCGLALAVSSLPNKNVKILFDNYVRHFESIPGQDFIYDSYDGDIDLFICLDCANLKRLGLIAKYFDKATVTINIDHHVSNDEFANYNFVQADSSSTSEIIFDLLKKMGILKKDIASAIYAGIVSDTGGFCHMNTSSKTLRTCSELFEFEIPHTDIYRNIILERSMDSVKLLTCALENLYIENNIAVSYIEADVMKNIYDTSGIAEFILNINDVNVSAVIFEYSEGYCKVSLRSKFVDVNKIANEFNGGGHVLAAGCRLDCKLDSAKEKIMSAIKEGCEDYAKHTC